MRSHSTSWFDKGFTMFVAGCILAGAGMMLLDAIWGPR